MAGGNQYSSTDAGGNQANPNAGVSSSLTPDQIAQMNAATKAAQDQATALQAQVTAQDAASKAGPSLTYNPLQDDGSLKSNYKLGDASGYVGALQKQQDLMGMQGRDVAAQQGQTATNQAESNLAMRGGAGSNNRALLEMQGQKQGLANAQSASNTAATNNANIGVQGAGAQLQIDQANLQNQLTAGQNVNAFNLDKYNQNMAVKAANDEANATTQAASGGKK